MVWMLMLTALATAQEPAQPVQKHPDLIFIATDLPSNVGTVRCGLYNNSDTWLKKGAAMANATAKPVNGQATCVFTNIPPGVYGASYMHDLNDNGVMDYNLVGMPKEPWGISRDPVVIMSAPGFDKATITHPSKTPHKAKAR